MSDVKWWGNNDYSLEEKVVGTWIDGKPIYQKTVNFGNLPNNAVKQLEHNIDNLDAVVEIKGWAKRSNHSILPIPFPGNASNTVEISIYPFTSIYCLTKTDMSLWSAYITLLYTKTTD